MALLLGRFATRFSKKIPVTSVSFLSTEKPLPANQKKKKNPPEIRINLIESGSLTVMSMESAKKLANHRGFQLIPVEDAAHWMLVGNRKAFQLLHPGSKVASKKESDVKEKGFKGLKRAVFSLGIQDHDIQTKTKQIEKWVSNGYVVDIAIDVSDKSNAIRGQIESLIKDMAILPGTVKRNSSTLFRIQYEPIQKIVNEESSSAK